jgi:hypothetical protein
MKFGAAALSTVTESEVLAKPLKFISEAINLNKKQDLAEDKFMFWLSYLKEHKL